MLLRKRIIAIAAAGLVLGGWQLTTFIGMGFAAGALALYAGEAFGGRVPGARP